MEMLSFGVELLCSSSRRICPPDMKLPRGRRDANAELLAEKLERPASAEILSQLQSVTEFLAGAIPLINLLLGCLDCRL